MTNLAHQPDQRSRELAILSTVAAALNREIDLARALETTLRCVAELCDMRSGWIWLLDALGQPYLAAARHLPPALASTPERMRGSCYCLDSFCAGDMAGAANISMITCSRLKNLGAGAAGLRYHASIPLYGNGRRLGVLNVASADWHELAADELRLLYTIGDLLSMAIERARLFERRAELGALEERSRLAREIHDTLAQRLTAISMRLETADVLLEQGSADARAAIQQALALTRAGLDEARRSVLDLRAAPLDGGDLAQALTVLAAQACAGSGVRVRFSSAGPAAALPDRLAHALFRIAEEALANSLHHAAASAIDLHLTVDPGAATLQIVDNGIGFDPTAVSAGRYGLIGMRERARLLGGDLELHSGQGAGTRLSIGVPL